MEMGADKALCLKLGYTAVSLQQNVVAMSKEVGIICQCLLQIYKCSHEHKLESFRCVGATELIPLLSQVLKEILRTAMAKKEALVELDEVLLSILLVFRVFAKLNAAKSLVVNRLKSVLMGNLANDALVWIQQPHDSMCYFSPSVFWETLGLLKDLTFRSESLDKDALLRANAGILHRLLIACCNDIKSINCKLQEWFTAVVWNLALDSAICERLLGYHISDGGIIRGLLDVLMHHSVNDKQSNLTVKIKRNAVSALGNLVADSRYHGVIFQDNTLALLPRLMNLVEEDSDGAVRRRAMRTIRYLVSSSSPEVQREVKNENLPQRFLANTIVRNAALDDENDHDMQIQACQVVIGMRDDSMRPSDWPRLLEILSKRIETTTDTKLVLAAAVAMTECFNRIPSTMTSIAFSDLFWKRLETAVMSDRSTHLGVSRLYLVLGQPEKSKARKDESSTSNPSILASTSTVNAMTLILSASSQSDQAAVQNVLKVLGMLMENIVNKKALAGNEGLLSGLVNLCLVNPRKETKDAAKQLVLQLVPEI
ncbi:MAG: hypothetical protein SGILL_002309 [Bacillariaceae sp.]